MSHHLGPPAALAPAPVVQRDRRIRLTAQLVGRMLLLPPADQPPTAEAEDEQGRSGCSPSRR
jgi:hypothetical protein